ncbi:uncharacterized protein N7483_004827 [Penicillium malachiteum]|uniref:uncharacterized protein n=1 Tax=Penicillium malachiteum TaxID=1324776 RepID=UPI002546CB5E|nr:uncharacterized protein N7483_004827 [Penicillium malachiteum]KAJ5730319.1 hypothetical protein N7483_004827 [Penicillium malachiteum]
MILNELSFKSKENAADIEECLAGAEMNRKQRRQISSITKGEAFRGWLGEQSGSSTLIVYGNMEIDACISPISFLTSTIGKYCKERGFIVLSYFCGLHGESDSYDILRTMIGQLLSQAELMVGSSLTISRNEFKGIKRRSLRTLNSLFAGLIEQLSSHRIRVVCLINTISTFETSEKVRETKSILSSLCRVARSLHAGKRGHSRSEMILKLLISDGQTSGIAHRYVKEDEIIEILEDAEEASDDELGIASEDIDEATGSSISSDEDD